MIWPPAALVYPKRYHTVSMWGGSSSAYYVDNLRDPGLLDRFNFNDAPGGADDSGCNGPPPAHLYLGSSDYIIRLCSPLCI